MAMLTIDDLRRFLRECAGEDDGVDLDGDIDDVSFASLGYDSLALLETISRIETEFGVRIPDEAVERMSTPREAVDYLNGLLAGSTG